MKFNGKIGVGTIAEMGKIINELQKTRLINKVKLSSLAKKIGISRISLWRYEEQIEVPKMDILLRWSELLGCSIRISSNERE